MSHLPDYALWSVYVIRGPGWLYVGRSMQPERRWKDHQARARLGWNYGVAASMRDAGLGRCTFEVVGQALHYRAGANAFEHQVIRQFRADGENVLNRIPYENPATRRVYEIPERHSATA